MLLKLAALPAAPTCKAASTVPAIAAAYKGLTTSCPCESVASASVTRRALRLVARVELTVLRALTSVPATHVLGHAALSNEETKGNPFIHLLVHNQKDRKFDREQAVAAAMQRRKAVRNELRHPQSACQRDLGLLHQHPQHANGTRQPIWTS